MSHVQSNQRMESDVLPNRVPQVIHQRLSEGAVLLLPADEVYFGLNDVGAVIWSLLPPVTQTFRDLCDKLCARYPDVSRAAIEQDARELLADMLAQRLVTPGLSAGVDASERDSNSS